MKPLHSCSRRRRNLRPFPPILFQHSSARILSVFPLHNLASTRNTTSSRHSPSCQKLFLLIPSSTHPLPPNHQLGREPDTSSLATSYTSSSQPRSTQAPLPQSYDAHTSGTPSPKATPSTRPRTPSLHSISSTLSSSSCTMDAPGTPVRP